MGLIGFLLPFIIIIGLIGLIAISINRVGSGRNKYINSKSITWLLGGYVVVLIISTVLFFQIPSQPKTNFAEEIDRGHSTNLEYMISQDMLDEVSDFIVNEKEIPYEKDYLNIQLNLNDSNDRHHNIKILVERKNEADQLIEAVIYQTPTFINDWNITEYIDPLQVDVTLSALLIDNIWKEFSYASFKKEFPFSQFEEDRQSMFGEIIVYGEELLFLRIPKDVELIEKENVNIVYLNE